MAYKEKKKKKEPMKKNPSISPNGIFADTKTFKNDHVVTYGIFHKGCDTYVRWHRETGRINLPISSVQSGALLQELQTFGRQF
jgi:hypothetical protein